MTRGSEEDAYLYSSGRGDKQKVFKDFYEPDGTVLDVLQAGLVHQCQRAGRVDPLVVEYVVGELTDAVSKATV